MPAKPPLFPGTLPTQRDPRTHSWVTLHALFIGTWPTSRSGQKARISATFGSGPMLLASRHRGVAGTVAKRLHARLGARRIDADAAQIDRAVDRPQLLARRNRRVADAVCLGGVTASRHRRELERRTAAELVRAERPRDSSARSGPRGRVVAGQRRQQPGEQAAIGVNLEPHRRRRPRCPCPQSVTRDPRAVARATRGSKLVALMGGGRRPKRRGAQAPARDAGLLAAPGRDRAPTRSRPSGGGTCSRAWGCRCRWSWCTTSGWCCRAAGRPRGAR